MSASDSSLRHTPLIGSRLKQPGLRPACPLRALEADVADSGTLYSMLSRRSAIIAGPAREL